GCRRRALRKWRRAGGARSRQTGRGADPRRAARRARSRPRRRARGDACRLPDARLAIGRAPPGALGGRPRDRRGAGRCRSFSRKTRAGCRMTSPLQQKLKVAGPVVVTANRLGDGVVVYRTVDRQWTRDLVAAAVVTTS